MGFIYGQLRIMDTTAKDLSRSATSTEMKLWGKEKASGLNLHY